MRKGDTPQMEIKLKPKELKIVEEYLINGFIKSKAYKVAYPNQSESSLRTESYKFFKQPHIKEYIEECLKESIGNTETTINKMITQLEYECFEKELDEIFTYNHKQKSMEMLIKLTKQQTEILLLSNSNKDTTIEVCIIED